MDVSSREGPRDGPWTVLVTATDFAEPGSTMLRSAGCEVLLLTDSHDKAEVDHLLATREIHAVVSRTIPLDAAALRSCPTLRVISKHGAGTDNVDVAAATQLGIPVTRTPGANAQSVAELALGLMIGVARRLPWLDRESKRGRWARRQDGVQLAGRRLGLLGCGEVGSRVARLGGAIGMEVVAFDPCLDSSQIASHGVGLDGASPNNLRVADSVEDLLVQADILSLHLPLTSETHHLVGAQEIASLPAGSILVNTARGALVDTAALVRGLRAGHLGGAGLDAVEGEPLAPEHPLHGFDTVVLTPHVGGSTVEARVQVAVDAARNILDVLRGAVPPTRVQVNREVFSDTS